MSPGTWPSSKEYDTIPELRQETGSLVYRHSNLTRTNDYFMCILDIFYSPLSFCWNIISLIHLLVYVGWLHWTGLVSCVCGRNWLDWRSRKLKLSSTRYLGGLMFASVLSLTKCFRLYMNII